MSSVDVLTVGRGPGLVVIPGTTRRAHHYRELATALAGSYTVHVIERRGRGASPGQGPGYGLDREVDDALEVLDRTGSERLFGHSYGGLVALHAALRRDLARLVVYEPAVSVGGSFPMDYLPRLSQLVAAGRAATATAAFLGGAGFMPSGPHMVALFWLSQRLTTDGRGLRAVLPTVPPELEVVRAADSDGTRYAAITAPTLLLGGARSPSYLLEVLPLLAAVIPDTKVVISPDMDHNAPDIGAPAAIAELIRA